MKIYLISNNTDTLTGLRLAGIQGSLAQNAEEVKTELNKALDDPEIGILLIMEKLVESCPEIINDIKLNRHLPLIVEIPDRHGSGRREDFIEGYIKEAIGVKL